VGRAFKKGGQKADVTVAIVLGNFLYIDGGELNQATVLNGVKYALVSTQNRLVFRPFGLCCNVLFPDMSLFMSSISKSFSRLVILGSQPGGYSNLLCREPAYGNRLTCICSM
jgi:hypothetical protein